MVIPLPVDADRDNTLYMHVVGDTSRYGESRSVGAVIHVSTPGCCSNDPPSSVRGVYAGIILALVLYNLVLYFSIRERAYLYYSLYVFLFGSIWIARSGFFYQYLWPHHPSGSANTSLTLRRRRSFSASCLCASFWLRGNDRHWVDFLLLGAVGVTIGCCLVRLVTGACYCRSRWRSSDLALTIFYAVIGLIALRARLPAGAFLPGGMDGRTVGSVIYIFMFLRGCR